MDFVNIINDKYRSPIDNRVLIRRLSKDPIWSIIKSKYSFCTKTSHIIYCLENDVTELPMCVHCGNRCNTPMASLCSARCSGSAMINNIKFHNKGKTQSQDVRDKISKSLSGRKTQPCSEETKEKIRKTKLGKLNPMFGKTPTPATKNKQSEAIKNRILSGQFTPNSDNRHGRFLAKYKDKSFRSSWEAALYSTNTNLQYEKLRIPYYDTKLNKSRIYILDFVDMTDKIVYEVRPNSLFDLSSDKSKAAIQWCANNNYEFVHVNEEYIQSLDNIDFSGLSDHANKNLRKMLNANKKD